MWKVSITCYRVRECTNPQESKDRDFPLERHEEKSFSRYWIPVYTLDLGNKRP